MIIGREKEQRELLNLLEKEESQFCVVYGRRRVGKTYLRVQGLEAVLAHFLRLTPI